MQRITRTLSNLQILILSEPDAERAMTDSPAINYDSAEPGTGTAITAITSLPFTLDSRCLTPALTFRHDYVLAQIGDSQDVGRVEILADNGQSWTELASYMGGGVFGVETQEVETPEWGQITWQQVEIPLNQYVNDTVRLRFSLEADETVSDKGWVIDDVRVKSAETWGGSTIYLPVIMKER